MSNISKHTDKKANSKAKQGHCSAMETTEKTAGKPLCCLP